PPHRRGRSRSRTAPDRPKGVHLSDRPLMQEERPVAGADTAPPAAAEATHAAGDAPAPRARTLVPGPADALFLALAFLVPLLAGGALLSSDGDAAAHVRLGQWMLETGGLVRTSPFAFTKQGEPFLAFA